MSLAMLIIFNMFVVDLPHTRKYEIKYRFLINKQKNWFTIQNYARAIV